MTELSQHKITWMSNAPWASTGYGNQTKIFVPRLRDAGYEMSMIAFYGLEGGVLDWNGIRTYPKGLHGYGVDVASAHTQNAKSDLLITLIDAWVLDSRAYPNVRWCPWFPVDMEPLPRAVGRQVKSAFRRLVFTRFAEKMVNDAGMDCQYIPHGIETSVFKPHDMTLSREALTWPKDRFIVGMVAANQGQPSRKAFTPQIEAFAELKRKHGDVWMYIHTLKGDSPAGQARQAVNLCEFVEFMGLKWGMLGRCNPNDVDVFFPDEYTYYLGFPDQYMAGAYSAMDVHMLVSMGEGFGIPTVEAQACGTPVIVGDWTACGELCLAGWKVDKKDAEPIWTPLAAYQYLPRVGAIADCLERAYLAKGREKFREQAREGALKYDADFVMENYWKPELAKIFGEIDNPEVAPDMNLVRFE